MDVSAPAVSRLKTVSVQDGDTVEAGTVEHIGKIVYRNNVLSLDPTADADA